MKITDMVKRFFGAFSVCDYGPQNQSENTYIENRNSRPDTPAEKETIQKIAYFKNGFLYDVNPRNTAISLYEDRDIAYNAKIIVSDGITYNLENEQSIKKIKIPSFSNSYDTTSSLDYILRMCASNLRNEGKNELSILVLKKAIEIMPFSNLMWSQKDYLRIVSWLYEDGRFDEGDKLKKHILSNQQIKSKTDTTVYAKQNFGELAKHTDLIVFASYSSILCETCSIYSGRVYSVSGKSKKFPKLPNELKKCSCYHPGCNTGISKYRDGDPIYCNGKCTDAEESTNRPYKDNRTDEEKESYMNHVQKIHNQNNNQIRRLNNQREYYQLHYLIPEIAPKSFSAYVRCKNANTDKFKMIVEKAKEVNIFISQSY